MPHVVDAVGMFLRMSGSNVAGGGGGGKSALLYLTYAEFAVSTYLFVATFARLLNPERDLTVELFTLIVLLIETYILLSIVFRLYHRRDFRAMDRYCRTTTTTTTPLPDGYQTTIDTITNYHLIGSNVFVAFPALYALCSGSVRVGDHFTFPFLDVVAPSSDNSRWSIYACKYLFYSVPVYIAHIELCFINAPFVHYVGVLKCRVAVVASTIRDALAANDERQLTRAIKRHRELLTYFDTMKLVFAKPIMLSILFNGIYLGMTTYFVIQAIQGVINQLLLMVCAASSIAAGVNMTVYAFYGSELSVFHDYVLRTLFDNPLFYTSKAFKRFSLIMMTRSSVPLVFRIGYIINVDLNLLVKILKVSYSVLNVLLSSPVKKV